MAGNKILIPSKTEILLFGTNRLNKSTYLISKSVFSRMFIGLKVYAILGIAFDSTKSSDLDTTVFESAHLQSGNIRRMRSYIPQTVLGLLTAARISCRFDYCNPLLIGIAERDLHKLWMIQNILARAIAKYPSVNNLPIFVLSSLASHRS